MSGCLYPAPLQLKINKEKQKKKISAPYVLGKVSKTNWMIPGLLGRTPW